MPFYPHEIAVSLAADGDWFIPAVMQKTEKERDLGEAEDFADLMAAVAAKHDRAAFGRLFDYFAPRVRSYMVRLGASQTAADDLVQDVMLTVWRRAAQFDPTKAGVGTWIFTIARNRRIDVIRRERRPELDPHDPALVREDEPTADVVMQRKQSGSAIRAALAELPEKQSQLLQLAYFEDMSHSEIAQALSLPLGTVKSRIRLASDKLRVKLLELN